MPRFEPHPVARRTLITGASSGIGEATARVFASLGHPVVLAARRMDRLEALADEIRSGGGVADVVALDLTDTGSIDEAIEVIGDVEIVVSNAGVVLPATVLASDADEFANSVQLNLLGAQRLVQGLVPPMVARGRGDVVFVTSDVVVNGRSHMGSYMAAKAGLEGMATAMRLELEGSGVRVGIVRPGPCSTEQGTDWDDATVHHILPKWVAQGHLRHDGGLLPENVADGIVYLATAPKGMHAVLLELQPEAPVRDDRSID